MAPGVFAIMCATMVAGLLYSERVDNARLRSIFKPLASLAFMLMAVAAGAFETTFGRIIFVGLGMCALGDVLLLSRGATQFLAGMGAFAAGHGAYLAAFLLGGSRFGPEAGLAGLGVVALAFILVISLWRALGDFRQAVIGYCAIISAMVTASVAHWSAAPSSESARLALAAVGFALSDISVARDRFAKGAFINRLWGLPLYYAAQCLFAASI